MCGSQLRKAVLALMLFAVLVGSDAGGQTSQPQPVQVPPSPPWVALVNSLAWPIAAIVMALVFREPLDNFLGGLATRVTKLSVFKVELELRAPNPGVVALLDDIRNPTTLAQISDSTLNMLEQAQSKVPADFAEINLGLGEEWLTSRLFIASVILERMRGVQVFVFLEKTPATRRRFVAVAPLAQVRWALAHEAPWLEAAWTRAYLGEVFPGTPPKDAPKDANGVPIPPPIGAEWLLDPRKLPMRPSPIESRSGALDRYKARQVVSRFFELLQEREVPPATQAPTQPCMQPSVTLGPAARERASPVTRELLETLLPPEAFDLWADAGRDAPRVRRIRSVLRRAAPFVALVQGDREYVRLVNRAMLLEEIAASLGEEPESTHV